MAEVTGDTATKSTAPIETAAGERQLKRQFRRLVKNPLSATGLVLSIAIIVVAILAPVIIPMDPLDMDPSNRLVAPSAEHLLGTDDGGRDVFSRVIFGARFSLFAALAILILATVIGTTVGLISGYVGGWVDEALMRITDMFLAFPALVLAMGAAAALGPSLFNAVLAVAMVWWPWYARLVRGQALAIKNEAYVESARVAGARPLRIATLHILRNCWTPIIVQMSLDIGYAILTLAGLSFIGLGAQPPTPEWGTMVASGRDYFLDQWWMVSFPGFAIFLSVMAFNLLGDGIQEAFSPKLHR